MNRFFELQEEISSRSKKTKIAPKPAAKTYGRPFSEKKQPRGIRNNNPGNIRLNKANDWLGKVPADKNTDGSFEQFTDYKFGVRALIMLLRNYIKDKRDTITTIFDAFAPATENNTQAYIKFVAKRLGIGEKDTIKPTRDIMKALVQAIAKMENGVEAVTDAQFDEGFNELPQNIKDELDPPQAKSFWESEMDLPSYYMSETDDGWSREYSEVRTKTLVVIEKEPASGDNGFLAEKSKKNAGALRVTNVKDFVDQVLRSLAANEKINKLTIYGHGSPGNVSLGDGQGWEEGKNISSGDWEKEFARLNGKFAPNATVFLGGCNTGAELGGSEKLKKMADILGVNTVAPTGKVYGNCTEETGSKHQKGFPGSPTLPPISSPSDDKKKADMSNAHSFTVADMKNSINAIYINTAKKPVNSANAAKFKFNDPAFIRQFIDGIDFTNAVNTRSISGKLNAQIFIVNKDVVEEYVMFSDYDFFLKKGDWTKGYQVKYGLKQKIKSLLEGPGELLVS
jgi:hypothetical protein